MQKLLSKLGRNEEAKDYTGKSKENTGNLLKKTASKEILTNKK
jgi:hypothetical protein